MMPKQCLITILTVKVGFIFLRLRGGMKLFYKSNQSKTSLIDVDPQLTVMQLKMKIAEKEGIPVPH